MEYCHEKRPDSPTYTLEPYFLKIVSDLLRHRYLQYMVYLSLCDSLNLVKAQFPFDRLICPIPVYVSLLNCHEEVFLFLSSNHHLYPTLSVDIPYPDQHT